MAVGQNLRYLSSRDYHLFKRPFKGHRGYGVLTHSHICSSSPKGSEPFLLRARLLRSRASLQPFWRLWKALKRDMSRSVDVSSILAIKV